LKNCSKSTVQYFFKLQTVYFQKGSNFNEKIRYGKKNSKWQPKIKMALNVHFFTKKSIGTPPIMKLSNFVLMQNVED
jgi:hypothetical protein